MVKVDLTEPWPVFGRGAKGISSLLIRVVSNGVSGSGANGTSWGAMFTAPGPLSSDCEKRPGPPELLPPPPPPLPPLPPAVLKFAINVVS